MSKEIFEKTIDKIVRSMMHHPQEWSNLPEHYGGRTISNKKLKISILYITPERGWALNKCWSSEPMPKKLSKAIEYIKDTEEANCKKREEAALVECCKKILGG